MSNTYSALFHRIHRIQILTNLLAKEIMAGAYHSAFKGKGMEFEEVREYFPGDEVRHIDWNVTARMQHPYLKLFREEREITMVLLIDISSSVMYGSTHILKKEFITEIAALLAFAAVKNNDKVGAIFFSDRVEKALPPRKGIQGVMRIIQNSMTFKPQGKGSRLKPALDAVLNLYKNPTVCVVISDFLFSLEPREVNLVAKRHDLIALMIQDPLEKEFDIAGALAEVQDLETGEKIIIEGKSPIPEFLVKNYWEINKEICLKAGASVLFLSTDKPYLPVLKSFFRLRARNLS